MTDISPQRPPKPSPLAARLIDLSDSGDVGNIPLLNEAAAHIEKQRKLITRQRRELRRLNACLGWRYRAPFTQIDRMRALERAVESIARFVGAVPKEAQ